MADELMADGLVDPTRGQTALITGASGYIAKHTVQRFLNAGYHVRGSVRRLERGDEVRAAVADGLVPDVDLDAALEWAGKVAGAINGRIEVRPFAATGKVADHMDQMS